MAQPYHSVNVPNEEFIGPWVEHLKDRKSISRDDIDQDCEFCVAIGKFQDFTDTIIHSLQNRQNDAVQLVGRGFLRSIYDRGMLPNLHDFTCVHDWFEHAIMAHSDRLSFKQMQWMAILRLFPGKHGRTLLEICQSSLKSAEQMKKDAEEIESLEEDPDNLDKFRCGHALKYVGSNDPELSTLEKDCQVCAEPYDKPVDADPYLDPPAFLYPSEKRPPIRGPCGHIMCLQCFCEWLNSSTDDRFTCPQCRACLVCRRTECPVHRIKRELQPIPIPSLLKEVLGEPNRPLHGFTPSAYWAIREYTRAYRSEMTMLSKILATPGARTDDLVYRKYEDRCNDLWDKIENIAKNMKSRASKGIQSTQSKGRVQAKSQRSTDRLILQAVNEAISNSGPDESVEL